MFVSNGIDSTNANSNDNNKKRNEVNGRTGEWENTRNDKEWECNTRSVSKICVKVELKDNTKHVYKYVCTPEYTNTDGHKSGSAFKRKHETNAKNANFKSHRTATKFLYS